MQRRVPSGRRDQGFTLIEVTFTLVLMGLLLALTAIPYQTYVRSQSEAGTMRELVSQFRKLQVEAITQDVSYRASIASDLVTVQRFDVATHTWTPVTTVKPQSAAVHYASASFAQDDGSTASMVTFTPRGSASDGAVKVIRDGSSKVYTIKIDGLTAHVSYS